MSDLTAELNLALCVDNDDTADYLTTNGGLRGSLVTVDGLFNSSTGHNHSGAHQGGGFTNLSPSGNLTVGGTLSVTGATTLLSTSHLGGAATLDSTLSTGGLATLQSLDVTTTSHLRGAITADAGLTVTSGTTTVGTLQVTSSVNCAGWVAAGPVLSASAGDLTSNRGNGQGYVFLGNGSRYLGFDGTNYVMPGANLYLNGDIVVLLNTPQTLVAKTLTSPTINGGIISSSATVGSSNDPIAHAPNSALNAMIGGQINCMSLGSNTATDFTVNFGFTFASPPFVTISEAYCSDLSQQNNWAMSVRNVTATGFTAQVLNRTGATNSFFPTWIAIGQRT